MSLDTIVGRVSQQAQMFRATMVRNFRHFTSMEGYDAFTPIVTANIEAFDREYRRIVESRHLTSEGKVAALDKLRVDSRTAFDACARAKFEGLDQHIQTLRAQIYRPPEAPADGLATRNELRAALDHQWVKQAVFQQLAALDATQREILARTTRDVDVLAVLQSGPPIIKMTGDPRQVGPVVEPLLTPKVKEDVQRARATAESPELVARVDELEQLKDAMSRVIGAARAEVGQTLQQAYAKFAPMSDVALLRHGADVLTYDPTIKDAETGKPIALPTAS